LVLLSYRDDALALKNSSVLTGDHIPSGLQLRFILGSIDTGGTFVSQ
jgi:hypothetical protein